MQVFKIATSAGIRFVRAASMAHARVRAFKVFGRVHSLESIGQQAPDIGATGYDAAVNASRNFVASASELRAAQSGGGKRFDTFYKVSERKRDIQQARAAAMLRMLGLA